MKTAILHDETNSFSEEEGKHVDVLLDSYCNLLGAVDEKFNPISLNFKAGTTITELLKQ